MVKNSNIAESREEAIRLGLARFRSDTPCGAGHVGMRYTLNRACVVCVTRRAIEHRDREKARYNAAKKAHVDAANSALQDVDVA